MRVFATCDIGSEALALVSGAGHDLEVWPAPTAPPYEEVRSRVAGGIEGLITTLRDRIDRDLLLAGASSLRVVAQDAVGLDNVDVAAATELRIPVVHTPDVLTEATAEFTIFLLGALARKLAASEELVRTGSWTGWHPYLPFLGDQVGGKTLAILGVGRIGRAVASRAVGLDMNLVLWSHRGENRGLTRALETLMRERSAAGFSRVPRTVRWLPFEEALSAADFVTLHVPLTGSTRGLIDEAAIARMRTGAGLINTSRGPVIDETALLRALRSGKLAGAALDVFETEPLPADSPLLAEDLRDRLRLTHHFGSGTRETRLSRDPDTGMAGRCVNGLLRILAGEPPGSIAWVANGAAVAPRE